MTDADIVRYPYFHFRNAKVNIFPLDPIATFTLDTLPAEFPFADLPISAQSGLGDVRRGNMFRVFDGSDVVLEGIHRKNQGGTTNTLYGLGLSQGDSGRAREIIIPLAAGQTGVSYSVRPAYTFMTRLDGTTIYKRWDLPYSDQGENPSAQGNIGEHRQATADTGTGLARLTFTRANAFSWRSGTLTGEWELPASGATLVGGYALTDEEIEVDFEPGAYLISCQIADSVTGTDERNYRYVWINDPTEYPAFSDTYKIIAINGDVRNNAGRQMTFVVRGSGIASLIYTGAPVLFTWDDYFSQDGITWVQTSDPEYTVTKFFGYIRQYETIENDGNGVETIAFTVMTPLLFSQALRFIPQPLLEKAAPDGWQYVLPELAHMGFFAQYVRDFHCRWWGEMHDYYPGDALDVFRAVFALSKDTMGDVVRECAEQMLGAAGDSSAGTLYMARNPVFEEDVFRDALTNEYTWGAADIQPPFRYVRNTIMQYSETEGGGWIYAADGESTAALARAGKGAPMQGVQTNKMPSFVAEDEQDVKRRVGHYHAYLNKPTKSWQFKARGHIDVFRPERMRWHTVNIASYDPMSTVISNGRYLVDSVATEWNLDAGIRILTPTFIPETKGLPARVKTITAYDGNGIAPTPVSWCYTWDFLLDDYSWVTASIDTGGNATHSTWALGAGWEGDSPGNEDRNYIQLTFPSAAYITSISYTAAPALSGVNKVASIGTAAGTSDLLLDNPATGTTFSCAPNQSMSFVWLGHQQSGTGANFANIVSVTICGTGPEPAWT